MSDEAVSRFLASEFPPVEPDAARFHVLPVPFEVSVSYGTGTAAGPDAIIRASNQLEAFDGTDVPGDRGIFTHRPVDCRGRPEAVLGRVRDAVAAIAGPPGADHAKRIPVVLGGEHSITAAAVAGVLGTTVDGGAPPGIGVVQIDAHADLRPEYEGSRLSHACVMRRVHAELGLPIVQIGVRALSEAEDDYRRRWRFPERPPIRSWDAAAIAPSGGTDRLRLPAAFPSRVYLTIDVDALDPGVMPSTGTPVPGGLGWYQLLAIIAAIARQRTIVAFDVVELAPIPGLHFADYTAAELVYRTMGIISRSERSSRPDPAVAAPESGEPSAPA